MGSAVTALADPLRLPPSPPRPVAAALSGGLLPCLEYLLRGAGRDPGGWQAAAVGELAWLGDHMAPLLAYGDAGEAAALVATLGKLLRRAMADPRVVEGVWDTWGNVWQAVPLMVSGQFFAGQGDRNRSRGGSAAKGALEAAGPEPEAAAAGVAEAAPGPASPASQQLASLLSFAACRWLLPLSRLAQHSLRADIGRGDGSGDSGRARRLLRTCANPNCANLDGDSEAGLRLTPCAGCGEAAYCCRDCWTAHWRAGHRAACARRLGGAG
ncbi:hypothetical protein GPECTOR_20g497 [Gonium pectorale]|uniref:phytol kinase n=1 Tax=Gonium pectorale TaxID=33097 RepID=A0A150GJJ3_GONPE|nr:hypothetical protein GPECTOR_20g497 [Gonium pectorale]|eukprot:KXZ49640.1 hypothetical protein GPECTOR_20g497 [Gonium pectorale]